MSNVARVQTSPQRPELEDPLGRSNPGSTGTGTDAAVNHMPAPPAWRGVSALDPGAAIAMLLSKMAHTQRKMAREVSDAAGKAEEAAQASKVQEMRNQADHKRTASYIQGGAGFVGALCCIPAETSAKDTWGRGLAEAGKEGAAPGAKLGTTHLEYGKDQDAAKIEEHEGVRMQHARARDKADASEKDAKELADKAMQLFKEYLETKSRCMEASILRM
jgi:hypothetical protein